MNQIVNSFISAEDKFMPEMHLRQLERTYRACGPFTKSQKKYKNLDTLGDLTLSIYIFINILIKSKQIRPDFSMM